MRRLDSTTTHVPHEPVDLALLAAQAPVLGVCGSVIGVVCGSVIGVVPVAWTIPGRTRSAFAAANCGT